MVLIVVRENDYMWVMGKCAFIQSPLARNIAVKPTQSKAEVHSGPERTMGSSRPPHGQVGNEIALSEQA